MRSISSSGIHLSLCDERDDAHLATAVREHSVDAGNQRRPQVVRWWAIGRHELGGLGLGWQCAAQQHPTRRVRPRGGRLGLRHGR